ncbi:MAG: 2-C-methyl-D-erythritol 4-phosphate cytidylyltransferase [Nitrospirae bacterium]|nr:2-C-methyl-D-erythritol 4-phosphate cytidylyltransferase [Nitrospirota bacterium]MBF0539983.1 2-C-methyl-D-erythritol 4-phosphate cytidylyltransferase [Nitrospirota bacterium]
MKKIAIIPSAGSGNRFGSSLNKTFHLLQGIPVILHVLRTFQLCPEIDEIIPVFKEDDLERGNRIIDEFRITKVKHIAKGGKERQDSILNALNLIEDINAILVIHDGARPLITDRLIRETISQLVDCDGVIPAVKMIDTIKEVEDGYIVRTLDRNRLRAIQTPQVFLAQTLISAYNHTLNKGLNFTDDASVIENYGGRVKNIVGDYNNIKITSKEDLMYADFLMKQK